MGNYENIGAGISLNFLLYYFILLG